MKFHVHVYRLTTKFEYDIDADSEEQAASKALELARTSQGEEKPAEKDFLSLWYKEKATVIDDEKA